MLAHAPNLFMFPDAEVKDFTPLACRLSIREMELNRMASFISQNLYELNPILQAIKSSVNQDNQLVWCLREGQDRSFQLACSLARMMQKAGFLDHLDLQTSWLSGRLVNTPESTSFLTGRWLELALRTNLINLHPVNGAMNIRVSLPDGRFAELDAVAVWDHGKYWFEATTGDITYQLKKMDVIHRFLGIPRENCLVVTSGYGLSTNHSQQVCCLWNLPAWIDGQFPRYRALPGLDWRYPHRIAYLRMQFTGRPK
jgi:hypothetical protein